MNMKILAASSPFRFKVKEEFDILSGNLAGICYMQGNLEDIYEQPLEKKLARAEMAKRNGHHSIFDHETITLYLENIPKLFAMLLNNEKFYTTSEKSARYTKLNVDGIEGELYNKWTKILKTEIENRYKDNPFFTDKRIEKLAQENARYFVSVYTPTSLAYTASYRQLNYIYNWLNKLQNSTEEIFQEIKPCALEFCKLLETHNLVDKVLCNDGKNRDFSLIVKKDRQEYFGDIYSTNYLGSFASFAQAQRHRSLSYELKTLPYKQFYVPKIIEKNDQLKKMWLEDMNKVAHLHPQGELVRIFERGTPEKFIEKIEERLCTGAQLEIMEQTKTTLKKYIENVQDYEIKQMLQKFDKGARCKSEYQCKSPCGFKEGIELTREI